MSILCNYSYLKIISPKIIDKSGLISYSGIRLCYKKGCNKQGCYRNKEGGQKMTKVFRPSRPVSRVTVDFRFILTSHF